MYIRVRKTFYRDLLMEGKGISSTGNNNNNEKNHHFVLVHGASHGAWCWYKIKLRLERAGHRVTCLDMASSGTDLTDPNTIHTFEVYDKPLIDFMSTLPETDKVILVGHSAGGLAVTHAMHEFGGKISVAVFVAATMLQFGFQSEQDLEVVKPNFKEYGDVSEYWYGLGTDKPITSVLIRKEFQRQLMYHHSPEEDSTLASLLLRPSPASLLAKFVGEGADKVQRVYIRCGRDHTVKPEQQDIMIKNWPPSKVLHIDTDHSPFFSAPDELFNLLVEASAMAKV